MEHFLHTFEKTIRRDWDNIALSNFRGKDWTFGQFAAQAEKLHIFFKSCGLEKGDKITLYAAKDYSLRCRASIACISLRRARESSVGTEAMPMPSIAAICWSVLRST